MKKITFCNPWVSIMAVLTIIVLLPIVALFVKALGADQSILTHWVQSGILWHYSYHTLILMFSVAFICALLGATMAWLVVFCQFSGKSWLEFCALLPFIMPAWIAAWSWKELLDYAGPWHHMLKWLAQVGVPIEPNRWLIPIDNLTGASFILAFSNYPYVYLFCRTAFLRQSNHLFESARLLNCNGWQFFYKIAMPLIRPALAAGILVVMMEVLNDFGTVKYFSIPVLALGIEDAWVNQSSPESAAMLSLFTLLIAFLLVSLEQITRKKRQTFAQSDLNRKRVGYQLTTKSAIIAILFMLIPIMIGFVIPFISMLHFASQRIDSLYNWQRLIQASFNSIILALIAAFCAVVIATLLVWSSGHTHKPKATSFLIRLTTLGYVVPGLVLAMGVLITGPLLTDFIKSIGAHLIPFTQVSLTDWTLVGTSLLLIYGWVVRFLSLAVGHLDSGFSRIRPSMVEAAHSLGLSKLSVLRRIYLPLLSKFMFTGGMMVFIDSIKELPMTLLVRPFNKELLSVYVWQYGSMEQLEDAAPGAVILILVGIIPLLLLWRRYF